MTYAELAALQYGRSKSFADAQTEAMAAYCQAEHDLKQLQQENAKLRELVRDMNKWLWNGADCTECPFVAECDLNVAFESDRHANICIGWREIHKRMRELGVDA